MIISSMYIIENWKEENRMEEYHNISLMIWNNEKCFFNLSSSLGGSGLVVPPPALCTACNGKRTEASNDFSFKCRPPFQIFISFFNVLRDDNDLNRAHSISYHSKNTHISQIIRVLYARGKRIKKATSVIWRIGIAFEENALVTGIFHAHRKKNGKRKRINHNRWHQCALLVLPGKR